MRNGGYHDSPVAFGTNSFNVGPRFKHGRNGRANVNSKAYRKKVFKVYKDINTFMKAESASYPVASSKQEPFKCLKERCTMTLRHKHG